MANAYLDDWEQYIRLLCTLLTIINCVMTGYGYFCAPRRYWVMPNRWSVYTNGNNKGWTQWPLCTWPDLLVVTFVSWVNWLWVSLSGLSVVLAMLRAYFPGSRLLMDAVWCVGVYLVRIGWVGEQCTQCRACVGHGVNKLCEECSRGLLGWVMWNGDNRGHGIC